MSETTSSLVALNSRQPFAGSPVRAGSWLVAGTALLVALISWPVPRPAPQSALPETTGAQHSSVEVVAPTSPPVPMAVVIVDGLAPAAHVMLPAPAARVQPNGVSDRDGWAREPGAPAARPATVRVVSETPARINVVPEAAAPGRVVLEAPARVKVVPETPTRLKGPIAQAALRYGLPSDVLSAALARESANFKDRYVYGYHVDGSGRGVAGIDKRFHPEVSDEQALDPGFAIDWMGRHLAAILKKNGGDVYSALREYNGGPNFASERPGYQGRPVSELTRRHADSIMAHAARAVLT